ncbi:proton-coupled amino acid transporter-like protein CG1139 isoform X3 [Sitophilus oryzae]|uniref:Proton-coupled amino acid transporter-like protein CG1139 isoform X3 n=1 Tax=Sitophilus oryzae TaxID=7048 RepID=A0A6J2X4B8_SITOR|nr:proton-coupled amino acid transporter-like protein CG1139 isoform X3 [Sitophilus oryzae]
MKSKTNKSGDYDSLPTSESQTQIGKNFSAAINSRELLTPKDNAHTYILELNELKKKEAGEYNPHEYADIEHPTTFFETLIHLLKSSFGTGILAMPLAFSHSGWVLGIIGTAFIGLLCTYCMHMLVKTEYDLCKKKQVPSMTYPATAEAALMEGPRFMAKVAPYSGTISNTFLLLYQLGSCCVYTVFIGQNISNVVNNYYAIDERLIMLMTLLPLIMICFVKNLKFLAPLTIVANVITAISFAIIYYYIFNEPISLEDRNAIGEVKNYPLFFGTVLFALESIGMILPLQNEMKEPEKFITPCGVLNIGMACVTTLYITTGLFGYIAYGDDVDGSISYTINQADIAAQVCKLMLAFAIYTSYSLYMYVSIDIVWRQMLSKRFEESNQKVLWENLCRIFLVVFTFSLAVAIPYIDLFISLVGAFCISALGLAFPAIFDSCFRWRQLTGWKKILVHSKNTIITLFAIFGLVIGTYTSVQDIVKKFAPS